MEVKALARNIRVQPRKVRIVADQIRGKNANHAVALLRYQPSKGARELRKVLMSAIANAQENNNLAPDSLRIATIMVDEGPRLKRIRARAMGRANRIVKKSSHITVVVEDVAREAVAKPHGTRAKKRPTFAGSKGRAKKVEQTKEEPVAAQPAEALDTKVAAEDMAPVESETEPESAEAEVEAVTPEEQASELVEEAAATEEPSAEPEEATPVSESEAPEEQGSTSSGDSQDVSNDGAKDEIEGEEQK